MLSLIFIGLFIRLDLVYMLKTMAMPDLKCWLLLPNTMRIVYDSPKLPRIIHSFVCTDISRYI